MIRDPIEEAGNTHEEEIPQPPDISKDWTQRSTLVRPRRKALTPTPVPMDLVQRAFEAGNLDLVERAMALQQRWETDQARKAFENALADIRAELPIIIKNQEVDFQSAKGRTHYHYEDLAGIAGQIDPVLAKHGVNYRFRTVVGDKTLTVFCIIAHRLGHFEENSLSGPHDVSGNKNDLQAIGAAQTYLQRYTLKAALGLAAARETDARAVNGASEAAPNVDNTKINEEQLHALEAALLFKGMPADRLLEWARLAYRGPAIKIDGLADIPAWAYPVCLKKVQGAGDE